MNPLTDAVLLASRECDGSPERDEDHRAALARWRSALRGECPVAVREAFVEEMR